MAYRTTTRSFKRKVRRASNFSSRLRLYPTKTYFGAILYLDGLRWRFHFEIGPK